MKPAFKPTMKSFAVLLGIILPIALPAAVADPAGKAVFADDFHSEKLSPEWQVIEGEWRVADGALNCRDGGTIALNVPPGSRFAIEFEIAFPSGWMSVIPFFTGLEDYGTLYFGGGYWETFEMAGKEVVVNYVQRKDPEIVRAGGFQRIRIVSEYGTLSFTYDGKAKGPAVLPCRPGARIAFRSLPKSGLLKIRNFRLEQLPPDDRKVVAALTPAGLAKGTVHQDQGIKSRPGDRESLRVDGATGEADLTYHFSPNAEFRSTLVRFSVTANRCRLAVIDVESDGSKNNVFVIVHDASGEQHLALLSPLAWTGWQEAAVSLERFFESPDGMQRFADRWGGDGNQKLDFPITAVDIGVAKREGRLKNDGQVRIRNVRFLD